MNFEIKWDDKGVATFNYDSIVKELDDSITKYYGMSCGTAEEYKECKEGRAKLNKLITFFKKQKTSVKNEVLANVDCFSKQIDNLVSACESASVPLDEQIKEWEDKIAKEKDALIQNYANDQLGAYLTMPDVQVVFSNPLFIPKFLVWIQDRIQNGKWLNQTKPMNEIECEIVEKLEAIKNDAETISKKYEGKVMDSIYAGSLYIDKHFDYRAMDSRMTELDEMRKEGPRFDRKLTVKCSEDQFEHLKTFMYENGIDFSLT